MYRHLAQQGLNRDGNDKVMSNKEHTLGKVKTQTDKNARVNPSNVDRKSSPRKKTQTMTKDEKVKPKSPQKLPNLTTNNTLAQLIATGDRIYPMNAIKDPSRSNHESFEQLATSPPLPPIEKENGNKKAQSNVKHQDQRTELPFNKNPKEANKENQTKDTEPSTPTQGGFTLPGEAIEENRAILSPDHDDRPNSGSSSDWKSQDVSEVVTVLGHMRARENINDVEEVLPVFVKYHDAISLLEQYNDVTTINQLTLTSMMCYVPYPWRKTVYQALIDSNLLEVLKKVLATATNDDALQGSMTWSSVKFTANIFMNYSDKSPLIAKKLLDGGFVQYFLTIIKHEPYLSNQSDQRVKELLDASLATLHNCVMHVPNHDVYEREDFIGAIKPYMTSDVMVLKTLGVMAVSNLISEEENSKLEDTGAVAFLVNYLTKCVKSSTGSFEGFSTMEVAEALVRVAANDSNKSKLIDNGVLPTLVIMMQRRNKKHQHIAAKLVWILCFDDRVKAQVIQETGCVEVLRKLENSKSPVVVKAAKGALWKISEEEAHQKGIEDTGRPASSKHIFISYQHENKEIVHRIKDQLKANGHKIWIDTEQMGGSTLESMAGAVENAKVVLVCASEKYKLSPNCRTEAEYTFQLKKPIVPLMMQRHYKPDGWLGMLLGAKMYVNFDGKFEYEEAYQMLLKELQPLLRGNVDVVDSPIVPVQANLLAASPQKVTKTSTKEPYITSWDNQRVIAWMTRNRLDKLGDDMKTLLEGMNGTLLMRFCRLKREAPDFFYNQVKQQCGLDIMSILILTDALERLDV